MAERKPTPTQATFKDISGQRFGMLTALYYAGRNANKLRTMWECVCDCGKRTLSVSQELRSGHKKSCGCMRLAPMHEKARTHGKSNTPEYRVWQGMKRRCYRPAQAFYRLYGGRGIRVCDRWLQSFANFLADVGPRPSPRHSLDRFPNPDGNYEPENVRWATQKDQCRNWSRRNRHITAWGRTMVMADWCQECGISAATLHDRLRKGEPPEQALSRPSKQKLPH